MRSSNQEKDLFVIEHDGQKREYNSSTVWGEYPAFKNHIEFVSEGLIDKLKRDFPDAPVQVLRADARFLTEMATLHKLYHE